MIDNYDLILPLLEFDSDDDFYFLQIIKRKKENPELGSNSLIIKTYYIKSVNHFNKIKDEIIELCKVFNARAMINLNKCSFEKIALHSLRKLTEQILNKDYSSCHTAYPSVCGTYHNQIRKRWIIDIDIKDEKFLSDVSCDIDYLQSDIQVFDKNYTILQQLPTKNGYHIITEPFNVMEFKKKYPDIEIHRNNPTNLIII